MEKSREEIFQYEIEYYKSLKEKTRKQYNVLAILRLIFFLSVVGLGVYFIWKQQYN